MNDIPPVETVRKSGEVRFAAMMADMDAQAEASLVRRNAIEADYGVRAIRPEDIGVKRGPVHAASILVWAEIARRIGVPYIPAETIVSIPMPLAWQSVEPEGPLSEEDAALLRKADEYCRDGRFWRTEICAGEWIKGCLSHNGRLPSAEQMGFCLDDCRIMDMHWGMPDIKVIGRPLIKPARVKGWPVEFRVFCGGQAETGAVSFYYPQAGFFRITEKLIAAAARARELALKLYDARAELGLVPWMPPAEPDDRIGATIDFMMTRGGELLLVDAGPGFGSGAHPCCFIDVPVEGVRWRLADGVELR